MSVSLCRIRDGLDAAADVLIQSLQELCPDEVRAPAPFYLMRRASTD